MSANLYDILNVDESASVDEIRSAWKAAVADLDPTDRRFRAFNDAAAVLLDTDKRAAYDAELAAADDAGASTAGEEPAPAPVTLTKTGPAAADDTVVEDAADTADTASAASTVTAPKPVPAPAPDPAPAKPASAGPPGWALGAAGVGALAALALAVVLLLQPGGNVFADDSPKDVAAANASFEKASLSVEGAAERMIADVFSYNYKTMDADLERAQRYVTPELGAKQAKGWPDIAKDAADQKLVVQARAEAVALTRVSPDRKDATVVVFLVQDSTRNGVDQTPLRMWVSLRMVHDDGSADGWLIDDVCVDSNCDKPGS